MFHGRLSAIRLSHVRPLSSRPLPPISRDAEHVSLVSVYI